MDKELRQLGKLVNAIRLSETEHTDMHRMLEAHTKIHQSVPKFWRAALVFMHRPAVITLAALLMTGGVTLRAEQAVPGDVLYSVKTSINEKVIDALAATGDKQMEWDMKKTERRLDEDDRILAAAVMDIEDELEEIDGLERELTEAESEETAHESVSPTNVRPSSDAKSEMREFEQIEKDLKELDRQINAENNAADNELDEDPDEDGND